jgi:hypothetical protein
MHRRTVLATTAASYAVTETAAQTANILGANERVNVAMIGCGVRNLEHGLNKPLGFGSWVDQYREFGAI